MTRTPTYWIPASPNGVEPEHWIPVCVCNVADQDAKPRSAADILSSELPVAARQVPQSVPKLRQAAENPNGHRQQGMEPVRFSNGQQLTDTHTQTFLCSACVLSGGLFGRRIKHIKF